MNFWGGNSFTTIFCSLSSHDMSIENENEVIQEFPIIPDHFHWFCLIIDHI